MLEKVCMTPFASLLTVYALVGGEANDLLVAFSSLDADNHVDEAFEGPLDSAKRGAESFFPTNVILPYYVFI